MWWCRGLPSMQERSVEEETSRAFPLHLLLCCTHLQMPLVPLALEQGFSLGQEQLEGFPLQMDICSFSACLHCLIFAQGLEHFQEDCSYPNKCLEKSPEELPWGLRSSWGHARKDGRGVKPGHCFHGARAGSIRRLFSVDASVKFILLKLSSVA